MKKIIILLFLFFSFNLYSQDQEATLFFRDGTSLKGYASIKYNWIIKFRLTLDDKPDTWKDIMVEAVTFHGFNTDVRYEYQYEKADMHHPLLLEVIEEGNVNVYVDSFTTRFYIPSVNESFVTIRSIDIKKNKIYIKKPTEDLVIKFNNGFYYKEAVNYFKDCPSLVEKIKNKKFIRKKALEIFYYYNDLCDDEILELNKDKLHIIAFKIEDLLSFIVYIQLHDY